MGFKCHFECHYGDSFLKLTTAHFDTRTLLTSFIVLKTEYQIAFPNYNLILRNRFILMVRRDFGSFFKSFHCFQAPYLCRQGLILEGEFLVFPQMTSQTLRLCLKLQIAVQRPDSFKQVECPGNEMHMM